MHKFLMTLSVLAGAAVASGAHAAPRLAPVAVVAVPVLDGGALVQPVQYYGGWREREFRRHEYWEHVRREEARREWRREHGFYGRPYGYGYGYGRY